MRRVIKSKIMVIFVIIVILFQGIYSVFSMMDTIEQNKEKGVLNSILSLFNKKVDRETAEPIAQSAVLNEQQPNVEYKEGEILPEIEEKIRSLYKGNAEKYIKNLKVAVFDYCIPKDYLSKIVEAMEKGKDLNKVLIAYGFIYENYGTISDIDALLTSYTEKGKWANVFKEYHKLYPEYRPSVMNKEVMDKYLVDSSLCIDDLVIAERISQRGLMAFEDLILMKKDGKGWSEIKADLGIINLEDKLQRETIDGSKVEKLIKETNLSEQKLKDAMVFAKKRNKKMDEIINKVKSGSDNDDLLEEYFEERFK